MDKIIKIFSSATTFIVLTSTIIVVSVIGTLMSSEVAISTIYHSPWFFSLLILLTVNLFVCTSSRGRLRSTFIGFYLTHTSIIIIFIGAIVGSILGHKGFLAISENEAADYFLVAGKRHGLDFKLRLDDFSVEYYESDEAKGWLLVETDGQMDRFPIELGRPFKIGGYTLKPLRYIPDFYIDLETREVGTRSEHRHNPAVEVEINHNGEKEKIWVFEKFPDAHTIQDRDIRIVFHTPRETIKSFNSRVSILEGEEVVLKKTIKVNEPLKYKGYTFYQNTYDEENLSWSGLQVVKDPGVPIVYTGFILLLLGVTYIFYIKPLMKKKKG